VAASCPQCRAAVVPGMRTCQFCGKPVEFVEDGAEQSAPAELPLPQAAPEPPASEPPLAPPPVPSVAPPLAPDDAPEDGISGDAPKKKRPRSPAVPILIGLVVMGFLLLVGWRVLVALPGLNQPGPLALGPPAPPANSVANSAVSSNAVNAGDLGVDIYPGAHALTDAERRDTTDSTVVSQAFVSSDKMDLVIDFYKTRMVGQATIYASGNGVAISFDPSPQETIQIAIAPGGTVGLTRIAIAHTTVKSAN
jgi:hypothetical protein